MMEFLLNLAWLLLALPAYWLWRGSRSTPSGRKFTSLQCLLALAGMLVILFPVVSATDDLHAMRAEMDESPASKRTVRLDSTEKAPWQMHSAPALTENLMLFPASKKGWQQLPTPYLPMPAAPVIERAGRAPPDPFLG